MFAGAVAKWGGIKAPGSSERPVRHRLTHLQQSRKCHGCAGRLEETLNKSDRVLLHSCPWYGLDSLIKPTAFSLAAQIPVMTVAGSGICVYKWMYARELSGFFRGAPSKS